MFKSLAVNKIVETAEVFGQMFSREFNKGRPSAQLRSELAVVFDRALVATAKTLGTETAKDAVERIRPRIPDWLGSN